MFRSIVWTAAAVLILTGVVSTMDNWKGYTPTPSGAAATQPVVTPTGLQIDPVTSPALRPDWWWVAHASTGTVAVFIAVGLTIGATPPSRPVQWMRINLVILLVVYLPGHGHAAGAAVPRGSPEQQHAAPGSCGVNAGALGPLCKTSTFHLPVQNP